MVNPEIVVLLLPGALMVVLEGFPAASVHVPVPIAAMVAVPLMHAPRSGPASGVAETLYIWVIVSPRQSPASYILLLLLS